MITLTAPAKLNLALHIVGKQADGFHQLQSLIAFVDIADILHISEANNAEPISENILRYDDINLTLSVQSKQPLDERFYHNNLIYRAAKCLADYAENYNAGEPCPTHIVLEKHLPIGAGLGGGSSDAAATLNALNELWQLNLPTSKLAEFASELGSDIAACLNHKPKWMSATGNELQTANIQAELWALVVHPNQALATEQVYQTLRSNYSSHLASQTPYPSSRRRPDPQGVRSATSTVGPSTVGDMDPGLRRDDALSFTHMPHFQKFQCRNAKALLTYLGTTNNHLTAPAIQCCAAIDELLTSLEALAEVKFVRMSGSGSACFALFESQSATIAAQQHMQQAHPNWWLASGKVAL